MSQKKVNYPLVGDISLGWEEGRKLPEPIVELQTRK
jgi:hypothetical protein